MRVLSIGVIGTIGGADRREVANHPAAEIVGLCDVDANALAKAKEAHPDAFTCADYRQAFNDHADEFDAVIVYVEINGAGYLLDATDPLRPYTLLPYEALNGSGFLVRHPGPAWVTITPADQYQHERVITAQLDTAGTLTGSIEAADNGYSALASRRALDEADDQ